MTDMDDEPPNSWFSRLRSSREKSVLVEQELSEEAYEEYHKLLMKARPEIDGDRLVLHLAEGTVWLERGVLRVKARDRKSAEKILRNLHHYDSPPSLWPSYGLSYSIRKKGKSTP